MQVRWIDQHLQHREALRYSTLTRSHVKHLTINKFCIKVYVLADQETKTARSYKDTALLVAISL
jgi:hypothetical protein